MPKSFSQYCVLKQFSCRNQNVNLYRRALLWHLKNYELPDFSGSQATEHLISLLRLNCNLEASLCKLKENDRRSLAVFQLVDPLNVEHCSKVECFVVPL